MSTLTPSPPTLRDRVLWRMLRRALQSFSSAMTPQAGAVRPQRAVVAVVGSTGVGKSQLAVSLCNSLSKLPASSGLPTQGKVFSADSMQLYKGLDVITNKVTEEEKGGVEHWGLDVVQPGQGGSWDLGKWCNEADQEVGGLYRYIADGTAGKDASLYATGHLRRHTLLHPAFPLPSRTLVFGAHRVARQRSTSHSLDASGTMPSNASRHGPRTQSLTGHVLAQRCHLPRQPRRATSRWTSLDVAAGGHYGSRTALHVEALECSGPERCSTLALEG